MRPQMRFRLMALTMFLTVSPACARAAGGADSGGGDLCENRIKIIREDLKEWIARGGPSGLTLPAKMTTAQYSMGMLKELANAKIQCVGPSDASYPIAVEGVAKVCQFKKKQDRSMILCDFAKFQSMEETEQYVLVHHEYAGLAKLENPNGSDSTYAISNQISGYLVSTVVKRLAVKPGGFQDHELVLIKVQASLMISGDSKLQNLVGSEGGPLTPYTLTLKFNPVTQKISGRQEISVDVKDVVFKFFIQVDREKEGYVFYFGYRAFRDGKMIGWENMSSLFNLPTPQAPTMHLQGHLVELSQGDSSQSLWVMPVLNINGTRL